MKIIWQIEADNIELVKSFYALHKDKLFVTERFRENIARPFPNISHEKFWKGLIACLLSTQQKSGPESAITKFLCLEDFPLSLKYCSLQNDLQTYAESTISNFGGIRRKYVIANQIGGNWKWLSEGGWQQIDTMLHYLSLDQTPVGERTAANLLNDKLNGIGPKQSRNLLQGLGLTRFEIPIDSRITKWLNKNNFPVPVSSNLLSDENYYHFISEGFRALCDACEIYPCMLDAAIFSSFDKEEWSIENIKW